MIRYAGEDLGATPRIAILGSSKLGNFIVTTPLLRGFKERFPDSVIDFYGSPVNRAFEAACPWVDWRMDIFPAAPDRLASIAGALGERTGGQGYDLVVNCDGFNPYTTALAPLLNPRFVAGNTLGPGLSDRLPTGDHPWQRILDEPDWTTPAFLERYEGWLASNYIAELFCRMAFIETDFTDIRLESVEPPFDVPDVLIHVNATRDAKLWPASAWWALMDRCRERGLSVGLTGTRPKPGSEGEVGVMIEERLVGHEAVVDLRGRTSPIELAGAFTRTRACVSVDSGPLHVAAAVGCPTVAIFGNDGHGVGASPLELWMPRGTHVRRTVSTERCGECLARRFKNDACVLDQHRCMLGVGVDRVAALLDQCLATTAAPDV